MTGLSSLTLRNASVVHERRWGQRRMHGIADGPSNLNGVTDSPIPRTSASPPLIRYGTSAPRLTAIELTVSASAARSMPVEQASTPSRNHRSTAAASLLPPPRPEPTGIRFLSEARTPI